MHRTRTFSESSRSYNYAGGDAPGTKKVTKYIIDWNPGPGTCVHEQACLLSGRMTNGTLWHVHENTPIFLASDVLSRIPKGYSLNWNKLPSSTQTNILGIAAEIDDTIGIFTKKFWTSLSYGSFTWGVMPFVSDLQAVAKAVHNLSMQLNDISYEDTYTVQSIRKDSGAADDFSYDIEVKFHISGKVNLTQTNPVLRALDWLGLHPDLALAWDLIPMSFIIDYLVPIGDYLESFRGWLNCIPLYGWYSCSFDIEATYYQRYFPTPLTIGLVPGRYYSRTQKSDVLVIMPDTNIDPRIPSLRQLFNMIYLATRRK